MVSRHELPEPGPVGRLGQREAADLVSSEVDRQRIRAGIDSRGGVRAEAWQLHYGDG